MPSSVTCCIRLLACGVLVLHGVHTFGEEPAPPPACQGVVFSCDGSGYLRAMSARLSKVVDEACLPLVVEKLPWSHGRCHVFSDLYDTNNHHASGRQLADKVRAHRLACPDAPIYVIGHSAGCAVVLAAANHLPPCSVDRIIFLAPAVSSDYDLGPALNCSRSVDVLYSHWDLVNKMIGVCGTADGGKGSAGTTGFVPPACSEVASLCPDRLRQSPKTFTRHFQCTHKGYLREHILPLLECEPRLPHSPAARMPYAEDEPHTVCYPPTEPEAPTSTEPLKPISLRIP